MQAYAAGIVEAYLTKDLIFYAWKNMIEVWSHINNLFFCILDSHTLQYI